MYLLIVIYGVHLVWDLDINGLVIDCDFLLDCFAILQIEGLPSTL